MGSSLPLPLNLLRGVALGLGLAVSVSTASFAACSPGTAPAQKVSDFMANPSSLLGGGSRSSSEVTSDVRDLVVSDPATLPAIIGLLKGSPPPSSDMQKAIGTGLGLGASICIRPDPTFAAEIQSQLAGTDSTDAKQQYAAVTGNQLIGAVGGGAGAVSGGASGGQVGALANFTSSGGFQPFSANSVSNSPTNYFTGGVSGISAVSAVSTSTP
jgi:hypothetical protein